MKKHLFFLFAVSCFAAAAVAQSVTTTGCSCTIPLDSTFAIVPFNGDDGCNGCPGIPPQYRNDDSFTNLPIHLPFSFCFYGETFNLVFINNNGNISFGAPYSDYTALPFPDPSYTMIAPFWADVDTRDSGSGLVYFKVLPHSMIVKWDSVGYYDTNSDLVNTFQLIISDGTDLIIPNGNNVAFCYGEMQWTTGDYDGTDGFGGTPATVGVNAGDGVNYIQVGTFDHPGTDYNGPYLATSGIGWLADQAFTFNVCSGGTNIPPMANGLSVCDTVKLCLGDTLYIPVNFLSPEDSQITTVTVTTSGLQGWSLLTDSAGNPAVVSAQLIAHAANAGANTITFTAIDNGTPPATTVINLIVYIDSTCSVIALPKADFSASPVNICEQDCINFTDLSTNATSWQWSFAGAANPLSTEQNPQNVCYLVAGTYDVKLVASNGWGSDSITFTNYINVKAAPAAPVVYQVGTTLYCNADSTYTGYQWFMGTNIIPGATDTSLVITQGGNYNVQVSNANGCKTATGINVILALQNYSNHYPLSIYPNPVEDKFTIYGLQFAVAQVDIYNMFGQDVWSEERETRNPESETVLDVSSLSIGMYFVRITDTDGNTIVRKFVKQ